MWLPWDIAAGLALGLLVASLVARRRPRRWLRVAAPFAQETALVLALYALWQLAGHLSVMRVDGALDRGRSIWDLQRALHLPSEQVIQAAVLPFSWLVQLSNGYYAIMHVPALIAFLLWLFVRHRDRYPQLRNTLALLTGACLAIQLVPVAPPRMFPGLGFVDTAQLYHQSVYGAVGTGISDQLSAMPSVHVGWAVLIGVGVLTVSTSRWRWLVLAHPIATVFVVVVTANHWWLDGIAAVAIMVAAMLALRGVGVLTDRYRGRLAAPAVLAPEPVPVFDLAESEAR